MRIAVTGGTGFIGGQLVGRLRAAGHQVVVIARRGDAGLGTDPDIEVRRASVADRSAIQQATDDCDAIAHLAGINMERGDQTYWRVHEWGTANVVRAAEAHGVDRLLVTSYLRARPGTRSGYHASKWRAEELVRRADVPWTVLKPAAVFGPGDQLCSHLARWILTAPVLPVPARSPPIRPVAVDDLLTPMVRCLVEDRLACRTSPVLGPEAISVATLARRVARVLDRPLRPVPVPRAVLEAGGRIQERLMQAPIVTGASARILVEGMDVAAPSEVCMPLPTDLAPTQPPDEPAIGAALDRPTRLGLGDLRWPGRA